MTLAQMAIAAGADLKWLQNASAILKRPVRRSIDDARLWALVHAVAKDLKVPLAESLRIARLTLRQEKGVRSTGAEIASIVVNLERFNSVFYGNLSRARTLETPKRLGRPRQVRGEAITRAKAYGIDISLLEAALNRPVRERLERLNANSEFLRELRKPR